MADNSEELTEFVDININDVPSSSSNNSRNIISPVVKLRRRGSRMLQRGASLVQNIDKKTGTSNAVAHCAIHTAAMVLDRPKANKLKNVEGWFALELMIVEKVVEEDKSVDGNKENKSASDTATSITCNNDSIDNNGDDGISGKKLESYSMTSTGLYLDVKEARVRRGADIIVWPKTQGSNQVWRYDKKEAVLESKLNGLLLDVNGASQKANTKVFLYHTSYLVMTPPLSLINSMCLFLF